MGWWNDLKYAAKGALAQPGSLAGPGGFVGTTVGNYVADKIAPPPAPVWPQQYREPAYTQGPVEYKQNYGPSSADRMQNMYNYMRDLISPAQRRKEEIMASPTGVLGVKG